MKIGPHYDVVIIGAGMSGLAAGIRLAHFGRRVALFERHNAPGGLNGFYSIGGRKYDVGLHAVTNFVPPGVKGTPLGKLLRQLRIDREELGLCPQTGSRIAFGPRGETSLRFTNDFAVLEAGVADRFPREIDGFRRLAAFVRTQDAVSFDAPVGSARELVREHVRDSLLEEMIFCPLFYYGSSRERDMDVGQFKIMFRALFLEGLARPFEGVRQVIRVLTEKYREAGGERHMRCGVARIAARDGRAAALVLDDGTETTADHVLSSIGSAETLALCDPSLPAATPVPTVAPSKRLSFVEAIRVLSAQPAALGLGTETIIFFNDSDQFSYARPDAQVDLRSGVICLPNNFQFGERQLPEGLLRVTALADHGRWAGLPGERYQVDKRRWFEELTAVACRFLPAADPAALQAATVATDMFTPCTVERFTGHLEGAVYGAPLKNPTGRTHLANLYLCGTDQGLLGIVGSMLSGISMANLHILEPAARGRTLA